MRDIRNANEESGERSIRNIPLHKRARNSASADRKELSSDGPAELPHRHKRRRPRRFWFVAAGVVAVCAIFGLLLSTVFAGATVTIYPRTETVGLPATLQARPNAPAGTLSYKIITVTRSANLSVPAQGTTRVSRPATGVITITNTYNSSSQRLIANTRFEAPDGKIYRIHDSITVPGTTGTGSSLKPGTAIVTIYADSPGPEYNKPAGTTFTIPGFKGDPRYAKFSAKAGGALTNGFIGDEPAVAAADLSTAKLSLQKKLDTDVRSAATAEIPAGHAAVPGTLEVTFADLVQTPGADKTATISQSAMASWAIIRQSDLANAIAQTEVDRYQGEALNFGDVSEMEVTLASTSKRSDGILTLNLKGKTTLVWQFDKEAFLAALVGKGKVELQATIQAFQPAIAKADATIRPFWRGAFPSDAAKIKIKIAGEK